MAMLAQLGGWNWLIAGVVLMVLEVFAPGVFLFWLGLAAALTGVVALAMPWGWQIQLLVFAALSIAAVPLWRRFSFPKGPAPDAPFLNRRNDALVGRVFTLDKPIVDGVGTLKIDDSVWRVSGPDTPAGQRVTIVSADGALLRVQPA